MIDRVFGKLNYEYLWIGKGKLDLFNKEYDIILSVDGEENEEISESQRQAYIKFESEFDVKKIEKEIYRYYKEEVFDDYRGMFGKDDDKFVPVIKSIDEVGKLVIPTQLTVCYCDKSRIIQILFDCSWDIDAGMGIEIINEEIVKIGTQSTII